MSKRIVLIVMGVAALSLMLSACFRDASTSRGDPTNVPISNFINTPEEPSSTPIATLTSTPQGEPSSTFPVGGPPIENAATTPPDDTELNAQATLPPTLAIPSFTPRGSIFGDSSITPTSVLATQPIPDALITPTGLPESELECIHIVNANETLFSIATLLEVEVDQMIAVNPALAANPNALQIGQELTIPNCTPGGTPENPAVTEGSTPEPTPSVPEGTRTHTVQQGDTLFRIAIQYNTTVDAIVAANPELSNENTIIQPGQVLIIP